MTSKFIISFAFKCSYFEVLWLAYIFKKLAFCCTKRATLWAALQFNFFFKGFVKLMKLQRKILRYRVIALKTATSLELITLRNAERDLETTFSPRVRDLTTWRTEVFQNNLS